MIAKCGCLNTKYADDKDSSTFSEKCRSVFCIPFQNCIYISKFLREGMSKQFLSMLKNFHSILFIRWVMGSWCDYDCCWLRCCSRGRENCAATAADEQKQELRDESNESWAKVLWIWQIQMKRKNGQGQQKQQWQESWIKFDERKKFSWIYFFIRLKFFLNYLIVSWIIISLINK